jgi:VCBS repeat-containing protein
VVQWKLNALPDLPASWTTVHTHPLANNTTTDPTTNAVDVALGLLAENTSIDVRLIGATPEAPDQALVDDVLVTGVSNSAPTCADDSASTDEDTALNDSLVCSDVNGDDVDYTVTAGPAHGSLTSFDPETGAFTYSPAGNYHGPDSFKFKANDGTVDSNEATFSITVNSVNDAPTANDDAYATGENTPLTVPEPGVLDNDSDVENDPFTAVLDDDVAHGTLTLHANGSFEYAPDPFFAGTDTFTYHATDGSDDSEVATVTITVAEADADNDGLNNDVDCTDHLADKHVVGLSPVPPSYTGGVHPTLQAAVNAADDDDVISMYVNTTENVVIGGGKDLRIEGCGHKVTAATPSQAAIRVSPSAGADDGDTGAGERDIHIGDLDVRGATTAAGYLVETTKGSTGTSTLLKSVRSESNSVGIKVAGNGNYLRGSNGASRNSADGILVIGNSNLIEANHVEYNGGDGLDITGHKNTITDNDVYASGGDGIKVVGYGNAMSENEADGSGGDGFDVTGSTNASPNVLTKNESGIDAGNQGNGFLIGGVGNGKPNPVELAENEATKNGLNGFRVTGTAHELGKNKAYKNTSCEYSVVAGNFNSKDNKANGITVTPNTDGAAFPTACLE